MDQASASRFGAATRRRRAELGITLEQLALASGVSRGTLSRIENGALSTSLSNAVAIADALGSDLSALLAPEEPVLVRAGEGRRFADASGIVRTALARPAPGIEVVRFLLPPGTQTPRFGAHADRTVETVHVIAGALTYRTGEREERLAEGDTLTVRADAPHALANPGETPCIALLVVAGPR